MSLPANREGVVSTTEDATRRELLRLVRGSAYAAPAILTMLASRDGHATSLGGCDPLDFVCQGFGGGPDPGNPPPPPDDPPIDLLPDPPP